MVKYRVDAWGTDQVHGISTLTRLVDTANNSNKYRRFIVLWDPTDATRKMLVTHTGRWTTQCDRGDWSGGTYRFQKLAGFQWEKYDTPAQFLAKHVQKKLGGYGIHSVGDGMNNHDVELALRGADPNSKALPTGHAVPAAPVDITDALTAAVNKHGGLSTHDEAVWLEAEAAKPGGDELVLLQHYARIKEGLVEEEKRVSEAKAALDHALSLILTGA